MAAEKSQNYNTQPRSADNLHASSRCACGSTRQPWILVLVVVAVGLAIVAGRNYGKKQPEGAGIAWQKDYKAALALAQDQDKPLLLAFSAAWCPPCQQMKQTTFLDPKVLEISQKFIPIMIDPEKHRQLAQDYAIAYLPTYVILTPQGGRVDSFFGYVGAPDFAAKLNGALAKVNAAAK